MSDCLFCKIISGTIPSHKVYETDTVFAFLDIHPTNLGHTLVIPKTHAAEFLETPDDVLADLMHTIKKIAPRIMEAVGASGWNLMVNSGRDAGQVVFHTHVHIIPRTSTDGHHHWKGKAAYENGLADVAEKIRHQLESRPELSIGN